MTVTTPDPSEQASSGAASRIDGPAPPTPEALVRGLVRLLDVEEIDADLYRGARRQGGRGRVFGGQVIAQALSAAIRSTPADIAVHSLHAYFMRPGDEDLPIVYRVERDFDGRSFATRRVVALQRGKPILNMAASFQRPEPGLAHQADMPEVPPPEALESQASVFAREKEHIPDQVRALFIRPGPIEIRSVEARSLARPTAHEPRASYWFRAVAPLDASMDVHRAVLAYASDMGLLGASMLPHEVNWISPNIQTASLDHALWFHEDFRADEWLLYVTDSPWAGHGRGFNRGTVFSRDGRLVASVAQEGLIRLWNG